jgi:protein phosphatase
MNPTQDSHLAVAALSHPGEAREINEDRYSVSHYLLEPDGRPATLAIVADGIGGHQAGEVAAQFAIDTIRNSLADSSAEDPLGLLSRAIIAAGRLVMETAARDEALRGMGSTVAIAWVIDHRLYTASVGDSRIYLARQGKLRQISIDHTWVQEAVVHGILTPEEARNHPNAHVLHRHLGGEKDPQPDFRLRLSDSESDPQSESNQGLVLAPGDQLLLCSDGLTDLVEPTEIQSALARYNPAEAVASLVNLARERGGHDNITVIAVAVPLGNGRAKAPGCLARLIRSSLASVLLVVLVLLAVLLGFWFDLWPW